MTKRIIFALFILLMHGVCHADTVEDAKNRALISSTTDLLTTAVAFTQGARDLNPIIGTNPAMLIPVGAFKFYLVDRVASSNDTDKGKKIKLNFITAVWGGASINNLLVLAGVASPATLIIGAVSGYMIYETVSEKIDK
jgi:hypothetical protein